MIFYGIDNQTVGFQITNYQFPYNTEGDWDSNWLNIYLDVKSKFGNWQTIDASLTTWEVQELIKWFEDLSQNLRPKYTEMNFTEPNLSFELLNNFDALEKRVKIKFDLESRPRTADDTKEYFMEFQVDYYELKRISIELSAELSKYPERKR